MGEDIKVHWTLNNVLKRINEVMRWNETMMIDLFCFHLRYPTN